MLFASGCLTVGQPIPIRISGTVDVDIPGLIGDVTITSNVETVTVSPNGTFVIFASPANNGEVDLEIRGHGYRKVAKLVSRVDLAAVNLSFTTADRETGAFNVALRRPYTFEGARQPADNYPDTNPPSKLTNGVLAPAGSSFSDPNFVGVNAQTVGMIPVVDLGTGFTIDHIRISSFAHASAGITKPSLVEFFVSDDNTTWTPVGSVTLSEAERTAGGTAWIGVDVPDAPVARYVRVKATRESGTWIFMDEVEVIGRWAI